MKIKEGYPLNYLKLYYGFRKGIYGAGVRVSVNKNGLIDIGNHLHWISSDSYYFNNEDVLIKLIKKGIVVECD